MAYCFTKPIIGPTINARIKFKNIYFLSQELEKSRRESPYDFQSRLHLARLYNSWGFLINQNYRLPKKFLTKLIYYPRKISNTILNWRKLVWKKVIIWRH